MSYKIIESIAREHIYAISERGGLDERHNDSEDFITVSVWSLREALEAAYQAGVQAAD